MALQMKARVPAGRSRRSVIVRASDEKIRVGINGASLALLGASVCVRCSPQTPGGGGGGLPFWVIFSAAT